VIGRTVAQYTILARLGEGATGVVYQAEHATLHHLVAIKFLRPELMQGEGARTRFLREAAIAASLDHPGICPVVDSGEFEERAYLVMRYCAGVSLRDRIADGRLPTDEAVLFAIQIAEGLAAAHARGIVHRDIKPSNIVISRPDTCCQSPSGDPDASTAVITTGGTPRQQAKIIDFGLAVLPEQTRLTAFGGRVGTPAYMAPEQIAGGPLDPRTDLWALGAVLHEMATGAPAFAGGTPEAVMSAIQHAEPQLVAHPDRRVPAKLAWIIARCLQKDPARRYPDAGALLGDLRVLFDDLRRHRRDLPSWIVARRRWLAWAGGAVLLVIAAGLALAFLRPPAEAARGLPPGRPVPVSSGAVLDTEPAISPDGSRIAYASRVNGQADLYVVDAHGGQPLRLTDDPADDTSPAWFPDGSSLAFVSHRLGRPDVWKIGQLGGGATLLLADARDPAVSPDGRRLAFVRADSLDIDRIGVADLADPASARLVTGPDDGLWDHREPAWSHDGERICYSTKNDLWLLDPATGAARPLTRDGREDREPCWSAGDRHVYFSSYRDNVRALWRVRPGAGAAERLTLGGSAEMHPSLAATIQVLAYATQAEGNLDLLVEDRRTGRTTRFSGQHDDGYPSLTPDGRRLAFVSDRWGDRAEVWLQDLADGQPAGEPRRLTEQAGHASHPAISPDGAWVAYYRFDGDARDLWIVATGGGAPCRVTDHPASDVQPAWSPDGSELAFASDRTGSFAIWCLPVSGGRAAGPPRRLTGDDLVAFLPKWSPDGSAIAFTCRGEVWIVAADGATPPRAITTGADADRLGWERESGRIWVAGRWGRPCFSLQTVSPAGDAPRAVEPAVEAAHPAQSLFFDISGDGAVLARTDDDPRGRIWLLRADGGMF